MITDDEVLRTLRAFNPWWTTGRVPGHLVPPVRRTAFYTLRRRLAQRGWRRAVILEGARRVGKTTILYQLADAALRERQSAPRRVLYASFDHPILKLASLDQIVRLFGLACGFSPDAAGDGGSILLLLDEIQYTADWSQWLKWLVDHHPHFRIVATGSASARLKVEGAEPGVGRWASLSVPPLSFHEYAELRGLQVPEPDGCAPDFLWEGGTSSAALVQLVETCRLLEPHFPRYLLLGGFPELALLDDPGALDLLRVDVIDRVLKRDMVALFNLRNILELERLFVYLCLHTGEIVNRETLARDLGVSGPTVDNHLKAMELAHLLVLLPNVDTGGKKLLRTRPKAYLAHPSLRSAVLMEGEAVLADTATLGHLVETAVVAHTLAYVRDRLPLSGYWRDPATGREVDLVLTFPRSAALVEVKYQPEARPGPGLLGYRRGDPAVRRWLVTRRAEEAGYNPDTGLARLPAFAYLYLLGWLARATG